MVLSPPATQPIAPVQFSNEFMASSRGNLVWRAQSDKVIPTSTRSKLGVTSSSGRILVLFGGSQSDSPLVSALSKLTKNLVNYDLLNGTEYNLLDDLIWQPLLDQVSSGAFSSLYARPPSSTFTLTHRTPVGSSRYGCKHITGKTAEKVRKQNLLLVRTMTLLNRFVSLGLPAIVDLEATPRAAQ